MTKGSFCLPMTPDPSLEMELFGISRPDLREKYSFVMAVKKRKSMSFKPNLNSTLKPPRRMRLRTFPEEAYQKFCESVGLTEEGKEGLVELLSEIIAGGFVYEDVDVEKKPFTDASFRGYKRVNAPVESSSSDDGWSLFLSSILPDEEKASEDVSVSNEVTDAAEQAPSEADPKTNSDIESGSNKSGELPHSSSSSGEGSETQSLPSVVPVKTKKKAVTIQTFLSLIFTPYYFLGNEDEGSAQSSDTEY